MKKQTITALFLGITAFGFSTIALSNEAVKVVDPITGVVEGTATIISGTANTIFGFVPVVHDTYVVNSDNRYIVPGTTQVRPGIKNNDQYLLQNVGNKTTITDMNTGKSYWVKGVKYGTMDVNDGNGMTRYQYDTYIVKPK